jgi:hypothetical protein
MSTTETMSTGDTIPCPHCGMLRRGLWDHDWTGKEDEFRDIECDACEKTFKLSRVVSVWYTATAEVAS